MACAGNQRFLFLIIAANVLLVSAQELGSLGPARDEADVLAGLTCPQRNLSGSGSGDSLDLDIGFSGLSSGISGSTEGSSFDLDSGTNGSSSDLSDLGSGSGSASGSGSLFVLCQNRVYNDLCYTVANGTAEGLANQLQSGSGNQSGSGQVSGTSYDEVCSSLFAADTCITCELLTLQCGGLETPNTTAACADELFRLICSQLNDTDCLIDPEEPVLCDVCYFLDESCDSDFPWPPGSGGEGNGSCNELPVFKDLCYSVINVTEEVLSRQNGSTQADRYAACFLSFAADTCMYCEYVTHQCGELEAPNVTATCADESYAKQCSLTATDCIFDPEDPLICDACAYYTRTCLAEEDPLAACHAFGFNNLLDCEAVTNQDAYSCECFASGLVCSVCGEMINECSGEEPTLPTNSTRELGDLSEEEEENAVTMLFLGLKRFQFLVNDLAFRSSVADAVNAAFDSRKRQTTMVTPDDVIYVKPCPCQDGNDLNVVFFVRGDGTVVEGEVVRSAANTAGSTIASQVGADAYGGTTLGTSSIPDNEDDKDDDEFSILVIAAIAVGGLAVICVLLVLVAALVVAMVVRRKKRGNHDDAEKVELKSVTQNEDGEKCGAPVESVTADHDEEEKHGDAVGSVTEQHGKEEEDGAAFGSVSWHEEEKEEKYEPLVGMLTHHDVQENVGAFLEFDLDLH